MNLDLGTHLRVMLALHGLSQRDLAKRAGIDPAHLSRIVSGKVIPTTPTARKLLLALHADLLSGNTTEQRDLAGVAR